VKDLVGHINVTNKSWISQGIGEKVKEYIHTVLQVGKVLRGGNGTHVGELVSARVHELIENRAKIMAQTRAAFGKAAGLKKGLEMDAAIEVLDEEGEDTTELENISGEFDQDLEELEGAENDAEVQNKTQKMAELLQRFRDRLAQHTALKEAIKARIAAKLQEHKNETDEVDDGVLADAELTGAAVIEEEIETVENASAKLKRKDIIAPYLDQLRELREEMLNSTDKNETRQIIQEMKQVREEMRARHHELVRPPQVVGLDGVNQGLGGRPRHHNPLFSNNVALNHPVAPVPVHAETAVHTQRRVLYLGRIVAPQGLLRDVRAFQLPHQRQAAGRQAGMHGG
jgi:hypothetical protein